MATLWVLSVNAQFEKLERQVRAALADDKPYKALSKSQGALSRKGAPAVFRVLRADAYNRLGEYEKAKRDADLAKAALGYTLEVRCQLMGAYLGLGQMDSALHLVPEPLPVDADVELLYRVGSIHQRRRDWRTALDVFEKAVVAHPSVARVVRERGACHAMLGHVDQARLDMDRAVELAPRDPVNYNSRGYYIHALKGEHEAAIMEYNKAIKQDPNYGFAFSNRGWSRYRSGEVEKGRKDLELAIRKNPGNAYAHRGLGVIALETGDKVKACEYFTEALALGFTASFGEEVALLASSNCPIALPAEVPVAPPSAAPPVNAPGNAPTRKDNAP